MLSALKRGVKRHLLPDVLHEGEVAPDWLAHGHDGQAYFATDEWTVLVFYPKDDTPTCTSQLAAFDARWPQFQEQGCRVLGVNPADAVSHRRFAEKLGLRFPLLIDTDAQMARQFRALLPLPLIEDRVVRTVYLINPSRMIRLVNRGTPDPAIVLRSIIALKQASSKMM